MLSSFPRLILLIPSDSIRRARAERRRMGAPALGVCGRPSVGQARGQPQRRRACAGKGARLCKQADTRARRSRSGGGRFSFDDSAAAAVTCGILSGTRRWHYGSDVMFKWLAWCHAELREERSRSNCGRFILPTIYVGHLLGVYWIFCIFGYMCSKLI